MIHDNISTSLKFSAAKRRVTEENHGDQKYKRTVRSLQNTTATKNRTEDPTPNSTKRLENITLLTYISKVFKPTGFQSVPATALPIVQVNCQGKPYSCSKQCSNETLFSYSSLKNRENIQNCYCDSACNVFMDYCDDFPRSVENIILKMKLVTSISITSGGTAKPN